MRHRGCVAARHDEQGRRRRRSRGKTWGLTLAVILLVAPCPDDSVIFAIAADSGKDTAATTAGAGGDPAAAASTAVCLPTDLERVRRALASAHATALSVTSTISDELVATGALPPAEQYGSGTLSADNPVMRVAYTQFRGALEESKDFAVAVDACEEAGTLADPSIRARAKLLRGVAHLLVADTFEDFEVGSPPLPIGAANKHQLYDEAITALDEAVTLAAAQGDANLERTAVAVRARTRFGHAIWTARHGPSPSSPLVASPGAVSDAYTALVDPSIGHSLPAAFDLWPDLIPSTTYAELLPDGTLEAAILDPETSAPAPLLQTRLTDLFENRLLPKDLPVVSAATLRLIVAEEALANADLDGFITEINALRATQGLPTHPAVADVAEGTTLLRHHRRTALFLHGTRLADQYRFSVATPEWTATPAQLLPLASVPTTGDRLLLTGQVGPLPSVALVDGRAPWGCLDDRATFTLGGVAELLVDWPVNLLPPDRCRSEAVVFSHRNRMLLEPGITAWSSALGDSPTLNLAPPYELHLWVRGSVADEDQARMDLAVANSIFALNRTGIRLTMTYEVDTSLVPKVCRCPEDPAYTSPSDCDWYPGEPSYTPNVTGGLLNVYYVSTTVWDPPGVSTPVSENRGFHCTGTTTRPEDLIFIPTGGSVGNSLAHEVGHVLSLEHVQQDYPADGFRPTNLMTTYLMDTVGEAASEARDHLTLGQVFKTNVEASSWLNRSNDFDGTVLTSLVRDEPDRTRVCPCDPYQSGQCPPVSVDLAGPPDHTFTPPTRYTPLCHDSIGHETPTDWTTGDRHDWAVVLFDGNRVNEGCVDDVAVRSSRWTGLTGPGRFAFRVGNLVDVTACPSNEFFVFSQYHGMLHGALDTITWTTTSGEWLDLTVMPDPLSPPHEIHVSYWLVGGVSVSDAETALSTMAEIFDSSRVGVRFLPETVTSPGTLPGLPTPDPCDPVAGSEFVAGDLNVYLTDVLPSSAPPGAAGYVCGTGSNLIYVRPPSTTGVAPNELAHQMGHAFGLDDLVPGDLPPRDLLPNLMRDPSSGDAELRERLTVGQIFRAYWRSSSWLHGVTGLPSARCATTGDPSCPYLATDLRRE